MKKWLHKIKTLKWWLIGAFVLTGIVYAVMLKRNAENGKWSAVPQPVKQGTAIESVYGIGTVTASHSYQLKAGVTSRVLRLYVKEGDVVRTHSPLVELDGVGILTAPFDGTITFLPVKTGETLFAQSIVLNLVNLRDRYIIVSIDQRGAIRVRQGQKAKISFDSLRDRVFEGVVRAIYSHNNTFFVRIDIARLPSQILPGMSADVAIAIAIHENALLVPVTAIENGYVYVKRGHPKPQPVLIQTGIIDGEMAIVVSGDIRVGESLYVR